MTRVDKNLKDSLCARNRRVSRKRNSNLVIHVARKSREIDVAEYRSNKGNGRNTYVKRDTYAYRGDIMSLMVTAANGNTANLALDARGHKLQRIRRSTNGLLK